MNSSNEIVSGDQAPSRVNDVYNFFKKQLTKEGKNLVILKRFNNYLVVLKLYTKIGPSCLPQGLRY